MPHNDKGYHEEVVVATIDILGMKEILESNDKLNHATKIIGQINASMNMNRFYMNPKDGKKYPNWYEQQFGDSIYLIGDPKLPVEKQTRGIVFGVAHLIAFGIFGYEIIGRNFLLRCGIARGNLRTAQWKINDSQGEIFIGNSMSRANNLEKNQDWIGGAAYGNIDCREIRDFYLVRYDNIPLKEKYKEELVPKDVPKYAIDWVRVAKERADDLKLETEINITYICNKIDEIAQSIGNMDKEEVHEKIDNTKKFVEYCMG